MIILSIVRCFSFLVIFSFTTFIKTSHISSQNTTKVNENIKIIPKISPSGEESLDDYFFKNTCPISQNSSTCLFMSPKNISYYTLSKEESNCSFFENNRICVQYTKPHECSIAIKYILPKDIGIWDCLYKKQVQERIVDHDAVVLQRMDLLDHLYLSNSFNLSSPINWKNKHSRMLTMFPPTIFYGIGITIFFLFSWRFIKKFPHIMRKNTLLKSFSLFLF